MATGPSTSGTYTHRLSPKAAQLHKTLRESLNEKDRGDFARILGWYQRGHNIQRFVESLNEICTTLQQREEIYPLLRDFVPRKHRQRFDFECSRPRSTYGRSYSRRELGRAMYYNNTIRSLPEDYRNFYSPASVDSGFETARPSSRKYETRKKARKGKKPCEEKLIVLERDEDGLFGFSIRGGAEHNIALFVSSIDEQSMAEEAGLSLGDQIIKANEIDFGNLDHKDAVEIIQQASSLHLLIRSVGKIPGTYKSSSSYRWIDPFGNPVSPPAEYVKAHLLNNEIEKSDMRLLEDDERKVNLFVADGAELGLKIRGGMEHGLGIFIASVDADSGAERAGFLVGDQILDVNGKSFVNISHMEAVKALKSSQHMVITLKDIGILPHGKKVRGETKWIKEPKISPRSSSSGSEKKRPLAKKIPSFHDPMGSSLLTHHSIADHSDDILKIKARNVLTEDELQSFGFYLKEYRLAHLSLFSFLSALSDLLRTPDKNSLFQEIRSAILPRDLSKFDEWVDERTEQLTKSAALNEQNNDDEQSLCSYKSSNSSNSWFQCLESDNRQRLKCSSREKFDSVHSNRSRRTMKSEGFPPPPVFTKENATTPLSSRQRNISQKQEQSPEIQRTVSPSDIRFEPASEEVPDENHVGNLFEKLEIQDKTSCQGMGGFYEDTVDGLYEDVDTMFAKGSSANEAPRLGKIGTLGNRRDNFDTKVRSEGENTTTNSRVIDDEDIEDTWYAAVNNRDTWGSSRDTTKSEINRSEVVKKAAGIPHDPIEDMPVYSVVDKTKTVDKSYDIQKPFLDENELPPPIPDRLYIESDTDYNMNSSRTSCIPKPDNVGRCPEQPKDQTLQEQINGELAKRLANKQSDGQTKLRTSPGDVSNRKSPEDKTRNTGSTKRMKKSKRSKINIAQVSQPVESDHQNQPFVVELSKHCSNLGLLITGGTDTATKEIRIKSVQDGNTVAGSCPLLKPGQIILGVDEKSLRSVTSGIAAMAIRQAFHSDKTVLKLILTNDS